MFYLPSRNIVSYEDPFGESDGGSSVFGLLSGVLVLISGVDASLAGCSFSEVSACFAKIVMQPAIWFLICFD
jgi:hypothetical protein